jgi:hypothetical protein
MDVMPRDRDQLMLLEDNVVEREQIEKFSVEECEEVQITQRCRRAERVTGDTAEK